MPEGPYIVILKELLIDLNLTGKQVVAASGTTTVDLDRIQGQKVSDFKSWGKNFFICFEDFTIQIHLMLFGTYLINERKKQLPRLTIEFEAAEINFYSCVVKIIEEDLSELYDWSADVMSDDWNAETALSKLQALPNALVCDVLLDQKIFSGVGNIIKNEVLYQIRVHPLSVVGALPLKKLKEVVQEARIYSFDFLRWKKDLMLKKKWLAYRKKICLRCDLPILKDNFGKNKRSAYYCVNCQILYTLKDD